jgi:tetratricopeptide (TPR) repeat protein
MIQALGSVVFILLASAPGQAQKAAPAPGDNRASAYYNFSMGHLYAELAAAHGHRGEYVNKAIEHYKLALKADPGAGLPLEELSDLYMQSGRLRDAVSEGEEMLRQNPDNLDARRMLGRIYTRLIGEAQPGRINEEMLRRATEQFRKITEKDNQDSDAWLMLGRLYKMAQNSLEAEKAYKRALELDAKNEYALSGLATVYTDVGDTKSALEMWRRLSEVDPSPRTLRALASAYEQMRDYPSAAQAMGRALELAPQDGEIKRDLAEYLLLAEKLDEALKLYQGLAKTDPKDAHLELRLSQIFRQKRDYRRARAAQDKARALDPTSLDIRYNEVSLLEVEGRTTEAVARLKEILETTAKKSYSAAERSNRVILLERLALLYRSSEQIALAVETFQQMGQLDPDLGARAAAQSIDAYRQGKEFSKAEQEAEAASRQYPADRTVILVRASLLADLGRTEQAVGEVKRLFDGKSDREAYLALAQVYDKAREYASLAQALEAVEKLSQSQEEKETVYFMRGAMLEKLKKLPEAEAEFRKVLGINPDNASALNYLGYMFADRNLRLQEANELISRALEMEPHNGAFLDSLGWVKFRLGQLEEAENYLRLAVQRVSRDAIVHDHLGDVNFQQGKLREAIVQWERSLKEWEAGSRAEHEPAEVAKIQKKLEGAKVRLARESSKTASQPR